MNERAFIAQLEAASPTELSEILRRPSAEEQRVLEIYFGAVRLERLRSLALRTQRRGTSRGNVVVLHGIMGGELTVSPPQKSDQQIWMSIPRIAIGGVGWLRMTPKPESEFKVRPTGMLKKWYSEMLLGLAADQWNVQAFFYDWRIDLADIADALRTQIDAWFGPTEPVHLVAHSMGGLVSRTFILRHEKRWGKEARLIMLGTPNHGAFAIPQVITGALDTVRKLALVDLTHSRAELLAILNGFPGSLQMLPSPLVMEEMAPFYEEKTWSDFKVAVSGKLLARALESHKQLAQVVDGKRMSYIAGCNQVTKVDVANWKRLDDPRGYKDSLTGDGTVSHLLGILKGVPTYYVECEHGALPNHPGVVAATQQLLVGAPCSLPEQPPKTRALPSPAILANVVAAREQKEELEIRALAQRTRARTRGLRDDDAPLGGDEVRAGELLVRSFLSAAEAGPVEEIESVETTATVADRPAATRVGIRIRLALRGLQEVVAGEPPVDAISVGHYANVAPQNAELALDCAISGGDKTSTDAELLITSLHRRGVISAMLGQNFQLSDPRDAKRIIVLAGMGQPGTFREAELAVLARELTWMLGRSGREHLQTVVIGSGAGNLRPLDAVRAWLRGIRRSLLDAVAAKDTQLRVITFVEHSASNFLRIHGALAAATITFKNDPEPLDIDYAAPDEKTLKAARRAAKNEARRQGLREFEKSLDAAAPNANAEPVRLTIRLTRDTFEFAALTADASIPQRNTQIDPQLIDEANNLLPEADSFSKQLNQGNLLGRLLLPNDVREKVVRPGVPLVVTVDATTARVHWEMVSLTPARTGGRFMPESFLGTACGLTRQLRTNFAPLPEAPLASGRKLRVLVIADPAGDAELPGAQEEGETVAAIFEEFGRTQPVDVVRLFGPSEATRVAVLDQLINYRFDVLHYAGHCFFNPEDPPSSGWLFHREPQQVLTAHELSRIDRIPRFVFSNACESGITPDRASESHALLAPSFAEAFFERGVANFICTAWPVDDAGALAFARRFYRGLLGLRGPGSPAESAHEAMTAARIEIAELGLGGMQTWGAYQHYGDPNFRFGTPPTTPPKKAPTPPKKARPTPPRAKKK